MDQLEHKTITSGGVQPTGEEGVVEALVSVTGIRDNVGDIIEPGAYTKTLSERTPKGVWSHDWNTPVSKVREIKELMPGDPNLPKTLSNGDPWPADAGALYVKAEFNLATQAGKDAYENVKFFGDNCEWSIGYKVPRGGATKDNKTGIRHIKTLNLYEFSPVLFGAASEARSLVTSIKSMFGSEEEWKKAVMDSIEETPGEDFVDEAKAEEIIDAEKKMDEEVSDEDLIELLLEEEAGLTPDKAKTEEAPEVEERSESVKVALSPVSIERLQNLQEEIKSILEIALQVKSEDEPEVDLEIPTKSIEEALEDIVNSEEVSLDQKTFYNIMKLDRVEGDEKKSVAMTALDNIDAALDAANASGELLLKTLAKAIGDSLGEVKCDTDEETEEAAEEESTEKTEDVSETESKVMLTIDELKELGINI